MSSDPTASSRPSHREQWLAVALLAAAFGYPIAHLATGGDRPILFAFIATAISGGALTWASVKFDSFSWSSAQAFALGLFAFDIALLHSGTRDPIDLMLIAAAGYACLSLREPRDRFAVFFTLLVVCGVGWFSGAGGGPDTFRRWVMATFHLSQSSAETLVIAVRKTVHFSAYGVFGLSWRRLGWKMAIFQTFLLASFDEARQTTASNRSGSFTDVLLDVSGAIVLLTIAHFWILRNSPSPETTHE